MHVHTAGYICVPTLSTYGEVDPFRYSACFSSRINHIKENRGSYRFNEGINHGHVLRLDN